ncbi:MAG: isocitrate lyase/phosphoenolpyruvate mutase family protein [Deltaproteobacteria bacterium]|nr:isocitrate lyase/phosphoenolpyruvate mutase family protein [Deltaproteobacteria bacterium]
MTTRDQRAACAAFRALHQTGCFVLPNPWDAGTAIALHQQGFKALASTSAGLAYTHGLADSAPLEDVLAHLRAMVAATPLPVNADFQWGFAADLDALAENVSRCIATGVAGLSIEDATGDPKTPLFDRETAIARIRTARAAIDRSGVPVVLTARCEAWLVDDPDAERTALDRCAAFVAEGAECVFAPRLPPDKIAAFVRAVAPAAVNVVVTGPHPLLTLPRLTEVGVLRISVGGTLARVAWGAFLDAARSIAETGTFDALATAAPFATLDGIFGKRD